MSTPSTPRRGFTRAQVDQLLQPINPRRVLRDGKGHSHVSQQDVLAHLTRIFGFGNWDIDIVRVELVFETERPSGRWDVCYRAMARLTVRDSEGREICHYEDGSTATAQNQTRGDGHDLAYKSAISLSKKRAAIHLGDQFGLSLYNKGQLTALVRGTLVLPDGETVERDVQDGVEQQVSLGNDEIERPLDGPAEDVTSPAPASASAPASPPSRPSPPADRMSEAARRLLVEAEEAATVAALGLVWTAITALLRSGEISRPEADRVRDRVQELKAQLVAATTTEVAV